MRKSIVLLALALAACDTASVPLATVQADAEGRSFAAPAPGQATLYVFRVGDAGTLLNINIGSRNLGPLGNYNWFREEVAPGVLDVRCTGGESSKALDVAIAPGETRFVEVQAASGWTAFRCAIAEVGPADGRQGVLNGKRARDLR